MVTYHPTFTVREGDTIVITPLYDDQRSIEVTKVDLETNTAKAGGLEFYAKIYPAWLVYKKGDKRGSTTAYHIKRVLNELLW